MADTRRKLIDGAWVSWVAQRNKSYGLVSSIADVTHNLDALADRLEPRIPERETSVPRYAERTRSSPVSSAAAPDSVIRPASMSAWHRWPSGGMTTCSTSRSRAAAPVMRLASRGRYP
jgi:hypothetical protein